MRTFQTDEEWAWDPVAPEDRILIASLDGATIAATTGLSRLATQHALEAQHMLDDEVSTVTVEEIASTRRPDLPCSPSLPPLAVSRILSDDAQLRDLREALASSDEAAYPLQLIGAQGSPRARQLLRDHLRAASHPAGPDTVAAAAALLDLEPDSTEAAALILRGLADRRLAIRVAAATAAAHCFRGHLTTTAMRMLEKALVLLLDSDEQPLFLAACLALTSNVPLPRSMTYRREVIARVQTRLSRSGSALDASKLAAFLVARSMHGALLDALDAAQPHEMVLEVIASHPEPARCDPDRGSALLKPFMSAESPMSRLKAIDTVARLPRLYRHHLAGEALQVEPDGLLAKQLTRLCST